MSEAPSLREVLESSIKADAEASAAEVEPVVAEPAESPESEAEAAPAEEAAAVSGPARDESGRFAKSDKPAEGAPKSDPPKDGPAAAAQPKPAAEGQPATTNAAPAVKAPQSWKPAVRDLAAKLPAEFRPILEESNRREVETNRVLQESAQARHVAAQVQSTLAPYEALARANGMDAMSYAGSVLQTAAALQVGTPQQKAATIAQVIRAYGVDVDALAAALDGQPGPAVATYQQPVNVQAEVQRAMQEMVRQTQAQKAESDMRAFLDTQPEFIADVAEDMVAVFQAAQASGRPELRNMTPEQAYARACRMNDEVSKVLEARRTAEAARANAHTVQRSRAAATSIRGTPAQSPARSGKDDRSLRDVIEGAMVESQRT